MVVVSRGVDVKVNKKIVFVYAEEKADSGRLC